MSDNRRRYDAARQGRAYRQWYKTPRWQRLRRATIRANPFCRMHLETTGQHVPATKVDHVIPHHGDYLKFWHGELQGLCATCHDKWKQAEERRGYAVGVDADGWPTDPRHPFAK